MPQTNENKEFPISEFSCDSVKFTKKQSIELEERSLQKQAEAELMVEELHREKSQSKSEPIIEERQFRSSKKKNEMVEKNPILNFEESKMDLEREPVFKEERVQEDIEKESEKLIAESLHMIQETKQIPLPAEIEARKQKLEEFRELKTASEKLTQEIQQKRLALSSFEGTKNTQGLTKELLKNRICFQMT